MTSDRLVPGVRLRSLPSERAGAGVPIDLSDRILQFTFEDAIHRADKASLQLDNSDLVLFDRAELASGALWEVSWGYPGAMAAPRRVVVRTLKGFETLTLEAHSFGVLMDRQARTRTFRNRTRGQVAQEIAREHGFDGVYLDAGADGEVMDTIVQAGETDARFLRRMAAAEGRLFYVDESGFHFHPRRRAQGGSLRTFRWRDPEKGEVLSVQLETNLAAQIGRVEVRGRDLLAKQTVTAKATKDSAPRPTLAPVVDVTEPVDGETGLSAMIARLKTSAVATKPGATPKAAQREADAGFVRAEAPAVKLSLQVIGDPTLRAGDVIKVDGIGRRFSGLYHVIEVKHQVSTSGYVCDISLRRDGTSAAVVDQAATHGLVQGGDRQTPSTQPPGALEQQEFVAGENGRTFTIYLPTGAPVGAHDPEGQAR